MCLQLIHKKSFYNITASWHNHHLIYNTLYSSCVIVSEEEFCRFSGDCFTEEEKAIYKRLKIIIPGDVDERTVLEEQNLKSKKIRNKGCSFIILTTTKCNAKCYYCYEKGIKEYTLTPALVRNIIAFIKDVHAQSGGEISIQWFGGEPLLNTMAIDLISADISQYCREKSVQYSGTIISNGSLFTDDIITKIKDSWSIKNIQITIDGTKSTYEKIKDFAFPNAFERVVDNIKKLIEAQVRVSVRINYSKETFGDIDPLITFLHDRFGKSIYVYVRGIFSENTCLQTDKEYIYLDKQIADIVNNKEHYRVTMNDFARRSNPCGASEEYFFVINADGSLHKCTHFLQSGETVIGTVTQPNKLFPDNWYTSNLGKECFGCKCLPLCMGGCIAERFQGKNRSCIRTPELIQSELEQFLKHNIDLQNTLKQRVPL